MIYRFSQLIETIKTKADFEKWVLEKKAEVREIIYAERNEINQREVRDELDRFETLKYAWDGMMNLRKNSPDYDLVIYIHKKGYTEFAVRFPIDKDEYYKILEDRRTYCKENDIPLSCAYLCEWLWDALKDKIKSDFDFVKFHEGNYAIEDTDYTFVKKVFVSTFKK